MAETTELTIESREKVAFKLMERIAAKEDNAKSDAFLKPDPRTYFLTLFNQCMKATVPHNDIGDILRDKKPKDELPGSFSSRSY